MKKNFIYILIFTLPLFTGTINAQSDCDSKALKQELYQLLKPDYRYDKSKISEIVVKNMLQGGEIGVPILNTESYKLLFNTGGFPGDINIKIYDKEMGSENRTLLYSTVKEKKEGKNTFEFTPPTFKTFKIIYIDYIIPASTDESQLGDKGCIVFLMGYKIG